MASPENQRTSVFLREFLEDPRNREKYGRFVAKYQPLIKSCCLRRRLQDADAEDLTAAILLGFFERDVFADFVYRSRQQFHGWLETVVQRAVLTFLRNRGRKPDAWSVGNADAQESLGRVTEEMVRGLESICEEERGLVQMARLRVQDRVEEQTAIIFRMLVDEGRGAAEVAAELRIPTYVVWKARSRFLQKLREELPHLQVPPDKGA
jgi:RNA polymerase sigma factor (sigma-70 family)